MTSIIEDYLREVDRTLRVDAARKRQIVDELRSHLGMKAADLRAEDPLRAQDEIERQVLAEMGNPRDLALAYEPDGSAILKSGTGDTVLRVGAAVGRGVGKFLKYAAIALGVLLVVAIGVGIWAYYEVKPYAEASASSSEPVYSFNQECAGTPCNGIMPNDTFYVSNASNTVRFEVRMFQAHAPDTDAALANGSARVTVIDPAGAVRLDRTYNMTANMTAQNEATWAASPGNWTVSVEFHGFQGEIWAEGFARSHTPAAVPWD